MGVSVEGAEQLKRINHLRSVPAAVRFISAEPLLLFNIGQAYRLMGNCKQAILSYATVTDTRTGDPYLIPGLRMFR